MTTDKTIHRLNYQWQAIIHFYRPMVGQYDVIFIGIIKSFSFAFRCCDIQIDLICRVDVIGVHRVLPIS